METGKRMPCACSGGVRSIPAVGDLWLALWILGERRLDLRQCSPRSKRRDWIRSRRCDMNKLGALSRLSAFARCVAFVAGWCCDIGRGGTGELVVPSEQLAARIHTIEPADFASQPTIAAPSTLPSTRSSTTQPSPRGSAHDRRRAPSWRCANNLELAVELITPAMSRRVLNRKKRHVRSAVHQRTSTTQQ